MSWSLQRDKVLYLQVFSLEYLRTFIQCNELLVYNIILPHGNDEYEDF